MPKAAGPRAVDKVSIGARVCDPQHCDLKKTDRIAPKAALTATGCCGSQTRAPTLSTALSSHRRHPRCYWLLRDLTPMSPRFAYDSEVKQELFCRFGLVQSRVQSAKTMTVKKVRNN